MKLFTAKYTIVVRLPHQQERVANLEEVKDGDEEADVVHHGVGHRPVHRVRHGLREG